MPKKFIAILTICLLFLGANILGVVQAADTGTVTATVKVQNIAISVADGSIAYGTLVAGGTKDTTASGVDDSQTATNTGNVAEDFNIKGANVSNGCTWTLAATQGSEQYFHKFCNNGNCDSSPTWTALTTNYATLATNKSPNGTQEFDLQIGVPSSTSCTSEATVEVTVQAVAHS
jgi:hypothetical protein